MNFGGLKAKIFVGIGVPVAMLIILGITTTTSINSIKGTADWVEHTDQVIGSAQEILISAVNMETGMRGYLLAGKEEFLDPLKKGEQNIASLIGPLQAKVSDNPKQVQRLVKLEKLLADWRRDVVDPNISLRREIGDATTVGDLARIVGTAKGKKFFDKFRMQVSQFIETERALLEQRKSDYSEAQGSDQEIGKTVEWVTHTYEVIERANMLLATAIDMETGMRGYLLTGKEEFLEPYTRSKNIFTRALQSLSETVSDNPGQVKLLDEIRLTIQSWRVDVVDRMIDLRRDVKSGKSMDDLADLIGQAKGKVYFDAFRKILTAFVEEELSLQVSRKAENKIVINRTTWSTVTIIVVGFLVSLFIGMYIVNYVFRQVGGEPEDIAKLAARISAGDLTSEVSSEEKSQGISKAVQIVSANLKQVTLKIRQAGSKVSTVVSQISSAVTALTSSATEQAAAVNQVSATLSEIRETTSQTLEKATILGGIAERTSEKGDRGEEKLKQTVIAMQSIRDKVQAIANTNLELSEQTKQIGQITLAVNNISHQSKMLSVNASIEAAKAGDAGKGFSIVAEQIGTLAEQSEASTAQVEEILGNIQSVTSRALMATEEGIKEVDHGVELVEQTSNIMEILAEAIHETGVSCQQIVAAVRQEVMGIDQIATAMSDISEVTTQSVKISTDTSEAAQQLNDAVEDLETSINAYKV